MNYIIKCLEDNKIPYLIKKGNYKRVACSYNSLGTLIIRQPYSITDIKVINFCEKVIDWIIDHKPVKLLPHDSYNDGDSYLFLGKLYKLKICYSNHEEVIKTSDSIIVYTRSDQRIEQILEKYRMDCAELVFSEMLYKCFVPLEKKIKLFPKLVIKKSKSRWGVCYVLENKIMLNLTLIHLPLPLIEYVIFHELVHFIYPNHSKEFHEELCRYVTNEKLLSKKLRDYCILYK